jgi:hypothetical protein
MFVAVSKKSNSTRLTNLHLPPDFTITDYLTAKTEWSFDCYTDIDF